MIETVFFNRISLFFTNWERRERGGVVGGVEAMVEKLKFWWGSFAYEKTPIS